VHCASAITKYFFRNIQEDCSKRPSMAERFGIEDDPAQQGTGIDYHLTNRSNSKPESAPFVQTVSSPDPDAGEV
jgi:hypothetical protein